MLKFTQYCIILFLLCVIAGTISSVGAEVFFRNGSSVPSGTPVDLLIREIKSSDEQPSIAFFYNSHCGGCQDALTYLSNLSRNHPELYPTGYDLLNNTTNGKLFDKTVKEYNQTHFSYPVIFMGPVVLQGSDDISTYYEPLALEVQKKQNNPFLEFFYKFLKLANLP